ncbi:hypothetical protein F3Y22_tig00110356pilonHSYRG00163 [Hibiscus syriacus]|uniref:Uncharacterized protein n=1 Tax=Hibiscus syriacus TaxID=106335 RepID=A0A6A3AYJ3_HIBSY|nr:hypothetical protein F3Y22_tig00110356pilonHSYRG00163 [Hibiscus syriacus]
MIVKLSPTRFYCCGVMICYILLIVSNKRVSALRPLKSAEIQRPPPTTTGQMLNPTERGLIPPSGHSPCTYIGGDGSYSGGGHCQIH